MKKKWKIFLRVLAYPNFNSSFVGYLKQQDMKNASLLTPTNHYVSVAQENLDRVNGRIAYCNEALACNELANWERKEYQTMLDASMAELQSAIDSLEFATRKAA